ncbi:hypothetical protein [Actinotalea sp.]|uniref:hypothetical protein n=1 Tax=Actinotalea sp. TaxID=1872145 RepID=UPI0035674F46
MTAVPDVEWMAEAVEHARFDQLRQGNWAELRPNERTTRVRILRDAMIASGVAGEIDSLRAQADRTSHLLDLVSQRDRDAARTLAEHDAEIVRLSDQISSLRAQVEALSDALAETESRAELAESVLATVRDAVDSLAMSKSGAR